MPVFECRGVSRDFGPVRALDGVTLAAEPGRILGLLGPNGSGKTTLIKLANGLLRPGAGQLLICGEAPGPASRAAVSYMPERLCLPEWMSVAGLTDFYADFYADFDRALARELLARLEIDGRRRLRQLSKGARQEVQLALVMSRRAALYLLDEPFGGMDPASRDFMLDTITSCRPPEAAMLISTHIISDAERILDDVVFLDRGRVVLSGPAEELRESRGRSVDALFREVFKC